MRDRAMRIREPRVLLQRALSRSIARSARSLAKITRAQVHVRDGRVGVRRGRPVAVRRLSHAGLQAATNAATHDNRLQHRSWDACSCQSGYLVTQAHALPIAALGPPAVRMRPRCRRRAARRTVDDEPGVASPFCQNAIDRRAASSSGTRCRETRLNGIKFTFAGRPLQQLRELRALARRESFTPSSITYSNVICRLARPRRNASTRRAARRSDARG